MLRPIQYLFLKIIDLLTAGIFLKWMGAHGWLQKYILYRQAHPFPPQLNLGGNEISLLGVIRNNQDNNEVDAAIYQLAQQRGIVFGSPIMEKEQLPDLQQFNFPKTYEKVTFIFLDTLFFILMQEAESRPVQFVNFAEKIAFVTQRMLSFFLKRVDLPLFKGDAGSNDPASLQSWLDQKVLHKALRRSESIIFKDIKYKSSFVASEQHLQNLYGFLEIFYASRWLRATLNEEAVKVDLLKTYELESTQMRIQLLEVFGALIWADGVVAKVERKVLKKYLRQAQLPHREVVVLQKKMRNYYTVAELQLSVPHKILQHYVIEVLILLSLIDNQQAPQEQHLIQEIAQKFGLDELELDAIYGSVVNFFTLYGAHFSYLRENKAIPELQNYVQQRIMTSVRKNLDRIVTEIKETGELYSLLIKATHQPLSAEEKQKVKDQLLDIARTVPAVAIFCLPAGAVVLAVLIKVLPFNILPSAFRE